MPRRPNMRTLQMQNVIDGQRQQINRLTQAIEDSNSILRGIHDDGQEQAMAQVAENLAVIAKDKGAEQADPIELATRFLDELNKPRPAAADAGVTECGRWINSDDGLTCSPRTIPPSPEPASGATAGSGPGGSEPGPVRQARISKMNAKPEMFTAHRPDGWPLCPNCGEDELWSDGIPLTIETIRSCYVCGWNPACHGVDRDRD